MRIFESMNMNSTKRENATMTEFAFDVKLFTILRINAKSERKARELLAKALDGATVKCGKVKGKTLIGDAASDGADLIEVDGEMP